MNIDKLFLELARDRRSLSDEGLKEYKFDLKKKLNNAEKHLSPSDRVFLARYKNRPKTNEFIDYLFEDALYFHGDRNFGDDSAVIGGIANFYGQPVTFIGIDKGNGLDEKLKNNFGMVHPEGYRKAVRLARQAEKFNRPVITFIDTPGAYPGIGAEQRNQAEAIARSMFEFAHLKVPTICIITGEGSSGGAMALAVTDRMIMMENSIFSILSPEGFAAILWKDGKKSKDAIELMKLTALDLYRAEICDVLVKEDLVMEKDEFEINFLRLKHILKRELETLKKQDIKEILESRRKKFEVIKWD